MLEKLKEQTAAAKNGAAAVGKLLLELCEKDPLAAELVEQDLDNPKMSLEKCFESLRTTAKEKQSGGCYYMDREETETLIRKFYGLPEPQEEKSESFVPAPSTGILDLADLLDL